MKEPSNGARRNNAAATIAPAGTNVSTGSSSTLSPGAAAAPATATAASAVASAPAESCDEMASTWLAPSHWYWRKV